MKLSLNKEDVATALKEYFRQMYGVPIEAVKITPFGENIAEVVFEAKPASVAEKVTDEVG